MSGDRAPFATSGRALKVPLGYKIVRVDLDARGQVQDFIRNARPGPGSSIKAKGELLERPVDVKFGPDGKMYILDFGRMEMKNGREKLSAGTGKIFVLEPIDQPPATAPSR
jgi:hypothetical protein